MNYYSFIATYLSAILGLYVLTYSYRFFSEVEIKIAKRERIIILIFSIFSSVNNLYNNPSLIIPISLIILFLLFYSLFKDNFYKCLLLSNYISLLSLISEFVISIIVSIIVTDIYSVNNLPLIKAGFSIIYFWSYYFIYKIRIFKFLYIKILSIFESKKKIIFLIYLFLVLIGFMYAVYTLDYENMQIYIFSLLTISLFIVVIYYYFKELHYNQILNIKNKNLIENQVLFKTVLNDFRVLRHNLLNDFLFISSLCDSEVQKIINKKVEKYNINYNNFNDLSNIPEGLQGILYFKSSIARKQNIEFYVDGNTNFNAKELNKRLYIDLCEVAGIILDNAIEAASQSKLKAIYFSIFNDNNNIKINILNTYNNDIDLNEIGNKNYSTKKRNSGLGLYYINNLNSKIQLKKSIINDLFRIDILVKIK